MIWGILLGINSLLTLGFIAKKRKSGSLKWVGVAFLFAPYLGFGIYYWGKLVLRVSKTDTYDAEFFTKRILFESPQKMPDVEKELNIIPMNDAILVGSNQEKRTLILEQLKKGIGQNYRSVLQAGADSDSESAHYVATARMEVYKDLKEEVNQAIHTYGISPEESTAKIAIQALGEFVDSDLLTWSEKKNNMEEYLLLWEKWHQSLENEEKEVERRLRYLSELEKYEEMEVVWNSMKPERKTEKTFLLMLEMFYNKKEKQSFFAILQELKQSELVLTAEGLNIIRYWNSISREKE